MQSQKKKYLLQVLDTISQIKELQNFPDFSQQVDRIWERLADNEFRIAVVGEFSSGKSTFINALLGQDLLQHATVETTASITRIVNVSQDDPRCMTGRVLMRNGKEIRMPNLNKLKEYTTTLSQQFHVVEEISNVEIYIPFLKVNRPVVLIDTPGLNGVAEGHREQTVALIQKAHACIYLISRSGLKESDTSFLAYLTQFQKNFIFVQNFIDEIHESEGESIEMKMTEQKKILQQKVFFDKPNYEYSVCGVSALMELVSVDRNITRLYADSTQTLTIEDRMALHNKSKFEDFRKILAETFREDRMDEIQFGGTAQAMASWIHSLLDHISRQEQQARDFFLASKDKRMLDKLQALQERLISDAPHQRQSLTNFVLAKGEEIRKAETEYLHTGLENTYSQISAQLDIQRDISSLEALEKNLSGILENKVGILVNESNIHLRQKFQSLYQILLTRIDEYGGLKKWLMNSESAFTLVESPSKKQPAFATEQSRIEIKKQELEQNRRELENLYNQDVQVSRELQKVRNDAATVQRAQNEVIAEKERQLVRLGNRPQIEEYETSYTDYEYRGGLGFLDSLFGPKEVTRWRTVRDDSKGKEWDRKKAQIQNSFLTKYDQLSRELSAAKRRQSMMSAQQNINRDRLKILNERIRKLETDIEREKKLLEKTKKQAAQEYLNLRRTSLKKQIRNYLFEKEDIFSQMTERIKSIAVSTEKKFIQLAMDWFTVALEEKLQWIEQLRQEKSPEILRQAEDLREIREKLKNILKELERR